MKLNAIQCNTEYNIYLFNYCDVDGLVDYKIHTGFTAIRNRTDNKNSKE